jgi:hypothetical protein
MTLTELENSFLCQLEALIWYVTDSILGTLKFDKFYVFLTMHLDICV